MASSISSSENDRCEEFFSPRWRRPNPSAFVRGRSERSPVPCLVCGVTPERALRCSRCRAAIYCSVECQRVDHGAAKKHGDGDGGGGGNHRANCRVVAALWREKEELETALWTNDDDDDRDKVRAGTLWREDAASSDPTARDATRYCACLSRLVQSLSRGESWRLKKARPERRPAGNPTALALALDAALDLLWLDRADLRTRSCVPSILLELGWHREAYDYLKFWLLPETNRLVAELTQGEKGPEDVTPEHFLCLRDEDPREPPESWLDPDEVYANVGMVFELALLKHRLSLNRQASSLLALLHRRLNAWLLPAIAASPPSSFPPARSLLNAVPPGSDLQYRGGNAGGGSREEAAGVWQRSMIAWCDDPRATAFLVDVATTVSTNDDDAVFFDRRSRDDRRRAAEAVALADRLRNDKPDATADGIMMHPEMATLMADHLRQRRREEKDKEEVQES